jgi:hypothetical protein
MSAMLSLKKKCPLNNEMSMLKRRFRGQGSFISIFINIFQEKILNLTVAGAYDELLFLLIRGIINYNSIPPLISNLG